MSEEVKEFDLPKIDPQKQFWVSREQLEQTQEVRAATAHEFVDSNSPLREENGFQVDRRDFLKLMGASLALASSACVRRPVHKIIPYVNRPEGLVPGVPNYYASTCSECSTGCGTIVKSFDGRPIKLEGNPDHPISKGGLCARGQASVLNLYDPDRIKGPVKSNRKGESTVIGWDEADKAIGEKLKSGARVRLLTGSANSPSTQALVKDFLSKYPGSSEVVWEPINTEAIRKGQNESYGSAILPRYRFDRADVVVSLDADFLDTWISPVEFTKQFSARRKLSEKQKEMSRLYVFESGRTLTGSNADTRVSVKPSQASLVALAIAHELVNVHHVGGSEASGYLASYSAEKIGLDAYGQSSLKQAAKDLANAKGKSLVVGGGLAAQTEDAVSLHVAINFINSILGNNGVSVDQNVSVSYQDQGEHTAFFKLIEEMKSGKVDVLLINKANPVFTTPTAFGFAEAMAKVSMIVSFADRVDETAALSDFVCPDHHGLEGWSDSEPQDGIYSISQPTISPLFNTRSFQDTLLVWMGSANAPAKSFVEYLRNYWEKNIYGKQSRVVGFEKFWETVLRNGFFETNKGRDKNGQAKPFRISALAANKPKRSPGAGLELVLYASASQYDGRSGNNAWLMEMPDPVTKVTWDNYALISPKLAADLGVKKDGEVVELKTASGSLEIPAFVQPGMHPEVVAVGLGFGHTSIGRVGSVSSFSEGHQKGGGVNAFPLVQHQGNEVVYAGAEVKVQKTGKFYLLANTQNHALLGDEKLLKGERPIVQTATLKEWKENPKAGFVHPMGGNEDGSLNTVWPVHEYNGYRWAMVIDHNACTGCTACVIACQAENNIPTVGKQQIDMAREMFWMRIDRYYRGGMENPETVFQPMLCQHCENAPCETVCPVLATTHSDEGLNQQTYNRCVGTRYCANNCPYKVRRFNWFENNYRSNHEYPKPLVFNPKVTVRSRGVMEKCTFCVQRINDGKGRAKDEARKVRDGEIQTACQQSCPADAIVFGDINDPNSKVAQLSKDPRGYKVLEYLNVRPSITYLRKITNQGEA